MNVKNNTPKRMEDKKYCSSMYVSAEKIRR
jgi:ribosomal protein L33